MQGTCAASALMRSTSASSAFLSAARGPNLLQSINKTVNGFNVVHLSQQRLLVRRQKLAKTLLKNGEKNSTPSSSPSSFEKVAVRSRLREWCICLALKI